MPSSGDWLKGGFYLGIHMPHFARYFERVCISINRLKNRRTPFPPTRWILDSGAFTEISTYGTYRTPCEIYARQIKAWNYPWLQAAVSQDYMCEEFILKKTGLTVKDHQRLTIERYDKLLVYTLPVHLLPVLQGYEPSEYLDHLRQYDTRLTPGMWVGVGSVCKRNARPESVYRILDSIKQKRSDLRLHGFGLKTTALADSRVLRLLWSTDSMAWSYGARRTGKDANGLEEAKEFYNNILQLVQRKE